MEFDPLGRSEFVAAEGGFSERGRELLVQAAGYAQLVCKVGGRYVVSFRPFSVVLGYPVGGYEHRRSKADGAKAGEGAE